MIKSVTIHNFQSHRDSTLELSPEINVISGISDSGKSSIIRAIVWALTNQPSGNAFMTHNEKNTWVILENSNNTVKRHYDSKFNGYVINGNEYKALNRGVPPVLLDIFPIDIDINIQRQHSSPFLLDDSDGAVARFLNKTIDLEIIDQKLTEIESMKRKAKDRISTLDLEITKNEEQLLQYKWLDDLSAFNELEKLHKEMPNMYKMLDAYTKTIQAFQEIPDTSWIDTAVSIWARIEHNQQAIAENEKRHDQISGLIDHFLIESAKIDKFPTVPADLLKKIDKGTEEWKSLKTQHENIKTLIDDYHRYAWNSDQYNHDITELISKLPPTCPLCGAPVQKEVI